MLATCSSAMDSMRTCRGEWLRAGDGSGLKFSTSLETEYPQQPFCKQLAVAFMDQLQLQGKHPKQDNAEDQIQKLGAGTIPAVVRGV